MDFKKPIWLNNGSRTFFHDGSNTPSWLDISLVSDHMVSKCEWEVLNDLSSYQFTNFNTLQCRYCMERGFNK